MKDAGGYARIMTVMRNYSIFAAAFACAALSAAAAAQTPEELKARQCRSVHLNAAPLAENPTAIYAEITPLDSALGTYFCASCFEQGYIGAQELASGEHMVIFSVWDPVQKGDDHRAVPEEQRALLIQAGENVRTRRFGGEGTGGNSMAPFDWKEGETLRFLVVQKDDAPGFRQIAGYVYDQKKAGWKLISCWRTQSARRNLSYSSGFVEDFMRNYQSTRFTRRCAFGPVFSRGADGKWVQATDFRFTGDPTPSDHIRAEFDPETHAFILATGGDISTDPAWPLRASRSLPEGASAARPDRSVDEIIDAQRPKKAAAGE